MSMEPTFGSAKCKRHAKSDHESKRKQIRAVELIYDGHSHQNLCQFPQKECVK